MIIITGKKFWSMVLTGLLLTGCTSTPPPPVSDTASRSITPAKEPPSATGNPRSYFVFGKRYQVSGTSQGYRERGLASWYGPKFHGKKTSSGRPFDMYAISAAHKSLPIPTYVRVTHLGNGRSLVVRVDDRGPFVEGRIIDLSYAAAKELDMLVDGTAPVEVVALPPYQFLPDFGPDFNLEQDEPLLADRDPEAPLVMSSSPQPLITKAIVPAKQTNYPPPTNPSNAVVESSPFTSVEMISTAYPVASVPPSVPDDAHLSYSLPKSAASMATTDTAVYLQVGAFANRYNAERLQHRLVGFIEDNVYIDTRNDQLYKVWIGPFHDPMRAEQLKIQLADIGIAAHHVLFE